MRRQREAWCSVGAWERCSEATAQEEQEKGEEEEEKEEEEGNSWNHLHKPKGVWPVYCTLQLQVHHDAYFNFSFMYLKLIFSHGRQCELGLKVNLLYSRKQYKECALSIRLYLL